MRESADLIHLWALLSIDGNYSATKWNTSPPSSHFCLHHVHFIWIPLYPIYASTRLPQSTKTMSSIHMLAANVAIIRDLFSSCPILPWLKYEFNLCNPGILKFWLWTEAQAIVACNMWNGQISTLEGPIFMRTWDNINTNFLSFSYLFFCPYLLVHFYD